MGLFPQEFLIACGAAWCGESNFCLQRIRTFIVLHLTLVINTQGNTTKLKSLSASLPDTTVYFFVLYFAILEIEGFSFLYLIYLCARHLEISKVLNFARTTEKPHVFRRKKNDFSRDN
jgi:hypothetical protein